MNGTVRGSSTFKRVSDVYAWVTHSTLEELVGLTSAPTNGPTPLVRWIHVKSATELAAIEAYPLPLVLEPELALADSDKIEKAVRLVSGILIERRAQPIILLGSLTARSIRSLQRFLAIPGVSTFFLGADTCDDLFELLRTAPTRPIDSAHKLLLHRCLRLPRHIRDAVLMALESPHDWTVKRLAAEAHVSRRTLERAFRRVALESPSALLALLSSDERTSKLLADDIRNQVA